jgi:hypothetical protein
MIEELMESPEFWILGGGGTAMVLLGWIASKKLDMGSFPLWQLLILIAGVLIASAVFALRD